MIRQIILIVALLNVVIGAELEEKGGKYGKYGKYGKGKDKGSCTIIINGPNAVTTNVVSGTSGTTVIGKNQEVQSENASGIRIEKSKNPCAATLSMMEKGLSPPAIKEALIKMETDYSKCWWDVAPGSQVIIMSNGGPNVYNSGGKYPGYDYELYNYDYDYDYDDYDYDYGYGYGDYGGYGGGKGKGKGKDKGKDKGKGKGKGKGKDYGGKGKGGKGRSDVDGKPSESTLKDAESTDPTLEAPQQEPSIFRKSRKYRKRRFLASRLVENFLDAANFDGLSTGARSSKDILESCSSIEASSFPEFIKSVKKLRSL